MCYINPQPYPFPPQQPPLFPPVRPVSPYVPMVPYPQPSPSVGEFNRIIMDLINENHRLREENERLKRRPAEKPVKLDLPKDW